MAPTPTSLRASGATEGAQRGGRLGAAPGRAFWRAGRLRRGRSVRIFGVLGRIWGFGGKRKREGEGVSDRVCG